MPMYPTLFVSIKHSLIIYYASPSENKTEKQKLKKCK